VTSIPVPGMWVRAGLAGWATVAVVWAVDVGFQLAAAGQPAWWAVPNTLISIAPGMALTPAVFLAFRRLLVGPLALVTRVARYAVIGVAFWLLWSIVVFALGLTGIFFGSSQEAGLGTLLFRNVAGFSFNSLLLYSIMVMLHEAARHVQEARRHELRTSRLQAELARASTAALQAQLNPHFLFNTLHVASGLTDSDPGAARAVLSDLGELMRGSLVENGSQLVALQDEVRLVERYAGIQKARFRDRLTVEFEIHPDTRHLGVPPLLLQPLVENAVIHGVAEREEGGRVHVSATRSGSGLCLAVVDSGRGFPAGRPTPPRERVGLGGTRARLALLFGEAASLRFSYPAGGGFRVEVRLPEIRIPTPDQPLASAAVDREGP